MTRRLAQQIVLAAFAVALLLAPLAGLAPPATFASRTPDAFHWARQRSKFTLRVGDNVDGGWNRMLKQVVSDWNDGRNVTFDIVNGSTNPQECRAREGMVQVCNWRYGQQEGWLGLTRLYFDNRGDHVDAATVQMNDSFLNASGSRWNDEDARRHTLCHELGHTPGLDHVGSKSCMNDNSQAVFDNTEPINKDFRLLRRIYKHRDSTTTVGGSQRKDKDKDKKDCDRKKKTDRDERKCDRDRKRDRKRNRDERAGTEGFFDPGSLPAVPTGSDEDETVIVERLEDGRKVVTFITWAEGEEE